MKMKRNISRIKALFNLYENELVKNTTTDERFAELLLEASEEANGESKEEFEYDLKFSDDLYNGVLDNLAKIDRMIAICLEKYPIERLSYIDRNLIRIGTYELMFTDTPKAIVINEIVNLSKIYSQVDNFESSKFNNSVLDAISKRLNK